MNKILRISLFSLLMFFCGTSVFAEDTTLDFKKLSITATDDGFTLTDNGYTLTATKESGTTNPTQNKSDKDLRIYAKNTLKVSGSGFKQIVFNVSKQGLRRWADVTPSVGTWTTNVEAKTATWTNTTAVTEVSFTVGEQSTLGTEKKAGQFNFYSMVISSEAGEVTPPTPPAPVELETKTLAEFKDLPKDTEANLKLTNAKVVYVDDKNIYVREGEHAIMLFGTSLTLPLNATLNGEVALKNAPFYGVYEAKDIDGKTNTDKLTITPSTDQELDAKTTTLTDIIALKNVADLVMVKNVKIVSEEVSGKTNYYAVQGSDKVQLFTSSKGTRANLYESKANDEKEYNIIALFNNIYKGAAEIDPVLIDTTTGISNIEQQKTDEQAPLYNLAGQRVSNSYKGVVIRNGKKFINK